MFIHRPRSAKNCAQKADQKSHVYFHKYLRDEERRVDEIDTMNNEGKLHKNSQKAESDICKDLKEYKEQDLLEEKRRQKLRNESHELRLLQNQLQSALVSKELDQQNRLLREQKEMELQRKREEDYRWTVECEKSKKALIEEEEKERQKKAKIRVVLQEQMNEMKDKRKQDFEAIMKDREQMQKTMKHIQAEERAEQNLARRFRDLCRKEMEECVREREIQRQLEKEQNIDDTERLIKYQMERDESKFRMDEEKKIILAQKIAVSDKIGNELAKINEEKKKREGLLLELLEEERKAKEDVKYRQSIEKQLKEREQMRLELEIYRRDLAIQRERQLQEEERQMREDYLRQMAEQDKLEQLSNEKRRRKVIEHNKALREMIEVRRQYRTEEMAARIADFEKDLNSEKQR